LGGRPCIAKLMNTDLFRSRLPMKSNTPLRSVLQPKVAIRILGICILGCLTGFLIFDSPYWLAGIWTAAGTALLFYGTVQFVGQSERKLMAFLQSLNQRDFSVTFSQTRRSDNYDLHRAFNELNETFKTLRSDKESEHLLLQVVVEQSAVALICYDETDGEIFLSNEAAGELFHLPFIHNISSLGRVDSDLPEFVAALGSDKSSLKLVIDKKPVFLSVTSRQVLFKEKNLKLITFHDVSSELAAKEAETWQKLLRVLTHEISNSAIPLSTLSSYIHEMLTEAQQADRELTPDERVDLMESLKTIDRRSHSLKEFVQNFQSLNRIPDPKLAKTDVVEMISEATRLFTKEFIKENICLKVEEPKEPLSVYADKNLTMQVLINLIKNAVEAMSNFKEDKNIIISLEKIGHRYVNLHVIDSGGGIASEHLEQIFIPFFSTKKSGSGIGLSISQQIMQRQRGDLSVRSELGRGSAFTMTFSC
jgi:nitrogen fixation/metabolism regulation signal transduction histidine kinase